MTSSMDSLQPEVRHLPGNFKMSNMLVKVIKFKSNKQTYKISEIHSKLLLTRFTLPILLFIFSITKRQYVKFDIKCLNPHCLTQQLIEF